GAAPPQSLAALDPDQIDVDQEARARPSSRRGLPASCTDSLIGQEQDRREARDDVSAAPAHEQIVEPVPMAIREIARRVAQPLWAEAKQRGPSEPVSLSDAARIAGIDLEHEAQTWHEQEQQIDETQDGERA